MKKYELRIKSEHLMFGKISNFSFLSDKLEVVKLSFVDAMSFSSKIYSFEDLVKKYGENAVLKENEYYDGKIVFVAYPKRVIIADMIGSMRRLATPPREVYAGENFWYCDGTLRGCTQLLNIDYVSHAVGDKDLKMSDEMLYDLCVEIKGKIYKAMWDGSYRFCLDEIVFQKVFCKAFDYVENGKNLNDFKKYFEVVREF